MAGVAAAAAAAPLLLRDAPQGESRRPKFALGLLGATPPSAYKYKYRRVGESDFRDDALAFRPVPSCGVPVPFFVRQRPPPLSSSVPPPPDSDSLSLFSYSASMSISGRNAPLSPVSVGGSEWSVSKYPNEDGPYPNSNPNLASPSPPNSGGSNGVMSMNGFPPGPRSNGGPSPPASIARSSNGTNIYARSESGRESVRAELDDVVLGEHYVALRAFLNTRDPNHKAQPNKARDKLLRLSSVQFYELSTDVYDELIRRQSAARAPPNAPNAVPTYLTPEKNFHPKRNQARQRLSSLGPPRFRDLAADVFHELERRFPRFASGDAPRAGSSMSMRGPGGPGPNGFPPRGQSRMRRPSDASSLRGPPPTDPYGVPPSPGIPNGDYGRPMPKQLNQNNTIVPNKSTMLEEDDDGGPDDDAYGLNSPSSNRESKRSAASGMGSEVLLNDLSSGILE